ncbi:hypothetical protein B7C42_07750 [Nocardia cerradoensis]|uniref:ABC-2 type transporter transmembrane domain-containing protein n=1 Tax=Nocardia cerradoensis TaxID=85688 RepID=A0A231GUB6_9NOCA|nr:YhgE/Pip domain-containing protein [Nocardia cerradoensis]OXR40168.1 hypothetical protein B7C42_07750 [Nocardia cerradoensis]
MSRISKSLSADVGRRLTALRRSRIASALLILILIVPTLLSAVYMWILWDPTNYLDRIPVAVANDDAGSSAGGSPHNFGEEILDNLTSGKQLQFHRVTSHEAVEGLRQSRYSFSVIIPSAFTEQIESVTDAKPVQARIMVYYNDFNGTLGSSVADSVLAQAQQQITASIGRQYADQVLVGLNSLGAGLGDASRGSGQLAAGAGELADGSAQLATGLDQAASGSAELATGARQLSSGAGELATGATQLLTGTDELGSGANRIRDGIDQVVTPILDLLAPGDQLATDLGPLLDRLAATGDPAASGSAGRLKALLDQLRRTDAEGFTGQLAQLRDGTRELARQLTDPHADYRAGVLALTSGSGQLRDGAAQLDTGAGQLSTGLQQLAAGGRQVRDGAHQLDDGAGQLDSGLRSGAAQAPQISDVDASSHMFSEPFTLDVHNQEPGQLVVDGDKSHKKLARGSGPLIVLLATFLGTIVAWMYADPNRGEIHGRRVRPAARAVLRRMWIGVAAGVAAAGVASAYGAYLGWSPHNWPAMLAVVAATGAAAGIIAQFFVTAFGRVAGSMAAVAFFMFQLFAFGGVFPAGTTPPAFRPFEDIAPMTFARRMILRCDIGLYDRMFWISLVILVVMTVSAIAAAITARWLRQWADISERPHDDRPVTAAT